jgi:hypothetical protein
VTLTRAPESHDGLAITRFHCLVIGINFVSAQMGPFGSICAAIAQPH